MNGLCRFLYGSEQVEFKSSFGMQESIERLRAASKRSVFSALAQAAAVGRVDEGKVRLQRVIPMVSNSFKPFFIGRFEARGDGVYLSGRFSLLLAVRIFMTLWIGVTLVVGVSVALRAPAKAAGSLALLAALALPVFGVALVALGKWFARNDITWLSNVIRTSLGSPPTLESQAFSSALATDGRPVVLRVVAGVLAIAGAINLANVYGNWMPKGPVRDQFQEPFLRAAIAVLGIAMLALAVGVYQRRLLAWRLGLVFFAGTAVVAIVQMFFFQPLGEPLPVKMFMVIASIAVFAYWTWWWYAQRVHFIDDTLR